MDHMTARKALWTIAVISWTNSTTSWFASTTISNRVCKSSTTKHTQTAIETEIGTINPPKISRRETTTSSEIPKISAELRRSKRSIAARTKNAVDMMKKSD